MPCILCMHAHVFIYMGGARDISSQIYKIEGDESHKRNKNKMVNIFKGGGENCTQFGGGNR